MFIGFHESSALTAVPNAFIDEYMRSANGEFVKVYIYLLRLAGGTEGAELSLLADRLDLTEKDVLRALRYWEKQGLLRLVKTGTRVTGLTLLPLAGREASSGPENPAPEPASVRPPEEAEEAPAARAEGPASLPAPVLERLSEEEEFRQMIYVAEKYLGRTLSSTDIRLFAYLYEELKFPEDLIEYLIEYCVGNGHRSTRYMESVALGWHREGLLSVKKAKEAHRAFSRENREVMQAFGISGRVLSAEERKAVDRWVKQYQFSLDVIVEACNTTMTAIHQPSFEYAERILRAWSDAGVRTVEEARAQQEKRRISRKKQTAGEKKEAVRGRYRNYEQREVDYDALLAQGQWN